MNILCKLKPVKQTNASVFSCVTGMHPGPSGNSFEPNFCGASPVLSSMAAIGGQLVGFNGSQTRNGQLFLPDHFQHGHGQSSQPSTTESTGTTSSQYSVPHRHSPFENYMVCHLLSYSCSLFHITLTS